MIGVLTALAGFFAAVMSAGSLQTLITLGDIEAIISAAAFAAGIIIITVLTRKHSVLLVTGSSLFVSGLFLATALWTTVPAVGATDWVYLLAFSILPLSAALTYVMGLRRIGASMTSTIGSFSILLTVVFQIAMLGLGFSVILPSNITLAIVGGVLGVFGIYLIHRKSGN